MPSNGFGRASEKERQVELPGGPNRRDWALFAACGEGSLICGSGKAGIPDGKSDRQLLAKKGSYIKVRQVMGLDNASLLFWVLRKTRKTARAVPAALGGVHE